MYYSQEVLIIPSQWYLFCFLFLFFCIIFTKNKRRKIIIRKNQRSRKKGVKRKMPVSMLNDCIGKEVIICVEGELSGFRATIVSVEENWIKVEEKNNIRLINGDMITQISIPKTKNK